MTILESQHDENFAQQINSKFMEEKDLKQELGNEEFDVMHYNL